MRILAASITFLTIVVHCCFAFQAERPRGLAATATAGGHSANWIISRVAGTWPEDQMPHPSLPAGMFTMQWKGFIEIPRDGKYRFTLMARGKVKLTIDGKIVIGPEAADHAAGAGAEAVAVPGDWMELKAGPTPLICEFQKSTKDARIQLIWESDDFGPVPAAATAFSHDAADENPELLTLAAGERGRFLFEKQRCGQCHARADAAAPLPGPDLSKVGSKLNGPWIYTFLGDPQAHRFGIEMPAVFDNNADGAAARADLARYLITLKDGAKPGKNEHKANVENGKRVFAKRGCVACHNSPEGSNAPETAPRAPLYATGSKYINETALADFIQHPLQSHPAGTMPQLFISREECLDMATFLMKARDAQYELELPAPEPGGSADAMSRGLELMKKRGCLACHALGDQSRAVAGPSLDGGIINKEKMGCARGPAPHGAAPAYGLSDADVGDLFIYLNKPSRARATPSFAYETPRAIDRFGCLQCHVRDGIGGGIAELQKTALGEGHDQEIEQIAPPDLSRAGSRVRPEWLKEMFTSDTRSRPWFELKMPHFGAPAEMLANGLAAAEGEELSSPMPNRLTNKNTGIAGQDLIGKKGFNCIACHDLAGWEASVAFVDARGPDLTLTPRRIRESWYRRWLLDPQALAPGTKMPTFFPNGKSTLAGRHGLDTDAQVDLLYDYLALGSKAPLPAGLANNNGWSWIAEGRPAILRTPFNESPRTICLGFPGGVSLALDLASGRLFKIWEGGFLRMNGTQWTGQHGPYPAPEGTVLWTGTELAGVWYAVAQGQNIDFSKAPKPVYKGYEEKNGNYTFEIEVPVPNGRPITVKQRFVAGNGGDGAQVDCYVSASGAAAGTSLVCDIYRNATAGAVVPRVSTKAERGSVSVSTSTSDTATIYSIQMDPAGDQPMDARLTISWSKNPSPAPLPDKFNNTKQDFFADAPRVAPSWEGEVLSPDNPIEREAASYPIERIPVPEETVLQGGGLDFFPDGSLAICTRRGEVWILENATKTPDQHKWRRFAHGLHEPLGLKIVNGELYVLQKPELTKLVDSDRDGVADQYICYNAGWELSTNFHEFAFGLEYYKGSFYGTLGLAIIPGGATRPEQVFARGSAWRVNHDRQFEVLGLGCRTPNGTGMGPNGEFYYSDNQGDYIPACKIVEVKKGEFYGQRFALKNREEKATVTPPVCWFPYGKMSHSSSDIIYEDRNGKFGPFAGQLIVGEMTDSLLMRVQLETVKGRQQGTCWIFRRGFSSGVERIAWGPDDKLYVAQTTGGWGAVGPNLFALERVSYSEKVPFEMKSVHLQKDGFEIEFTKPVAAPRSPAGTAQSSENAAISATVEQFHYHYWATYGSPEIDRKPCKVTDIKLSDDGMKLQFKVAEMTTDRICEIRLRNVASRDGEKLIHPEAWYTLNEFPD